MYHPKHFSEKTSKTTSFSAQNTAGTERKSLKSHLNGTALGLILWAAGSSIAAAQQQAQTQPMQLPPVSVEGQGAAGYKTDKAESPKRTAPLRDTPQTVTVIPEQVLQEQNILTLRDALSTVPGITFGAGEGGGGYGDSINLRGYTANADITTDSLRDSAQYTRSDFFNTESVEVFNGANSVYNGSGSVGGTINLVSKLPKNEVFTRASAGIGTDNYYRATVDTNQIVNDTIAVRINAVGHQNDIPGRDVEENKRWGIAPSVLFGLGTPTRLTLSYHHQEDDNIPQYGVPYYQSPFNNGPLPGVDPSDYFGYSNLDTQEITINTITAKLEHEFSETFSVRNLTRWQEVEQYSVVNPPQGTYCLASGIIPSTGVACTAPNTYQPSGPRGGTRDTKNKFITNQLDLISTFNTGAVSHNFVIGGSASHESFALNTGNVLRNAGGALPNPVLPVMTLSNPNTIYTGPVNFIRTATQDSSLDNIAVYAFDTITIVPQFELNAGVRYEHNSGDYISTTYNTNDVITAQTPLFKNTENLFSYRVGAVYKPVEAGSIYIAYGNSKTPSKGAVNGSCTTGTFGAANFLNNCNLDPETAKNYEIGLKWDLADARVSVNAAVFRNDRTNYKVTSTDPTVPSQVLDGSARVDGVALGAVGAITDEWQLFANYTYLDSEVRQGVSDFTLITTGVDAFAGNPLTQTPKHAFSAWTTYQLPFGVTVGYGATYQSKIYLNNGAGQLFTAPNYWVHRAMASYAVNDQLNVQLNVNNLFDKEYYTRVRNNGWATPGETRAATLSVNYSF